MKSRVSDPQQPQTTRRQERANRRGRSRVLQLFQLLAIATTGGAVMLGSLALFAFLRSGGQFFTEVKDALTLKPPEETVDVRTVVIKQVQEVSELTTAVFTMEAVVPAQSDRKFGEVTIGKTNLLYVAYGEAEAGINLEALSAADVTPSETGSQVRVVLPEPRLLDVKIDVDRSNVYDYSRGLFNLGPDRASELQTLAQREAKQKIRQAACEQGILNQANERADLVVTQLLQAAGFQEVIVETTPASDPTCQALS
ncbi:MAG: DUF4230 domain-containing protein [Cyanobacteria bacterium J06621_11]